LPEPYHMLSTIIRRYIILDGYRFFSTTTTFKGLFEMAIFEIRSVANSPYYEYSTKTYPMLSSIHYV
jgi:hypothetical protein